MRECILETEKNDDVMILHIKGSLDAYSFPKLEESLNDFQKENCHKVVLDCTELDYMSSAALGILIGFTRKSREEGGDLKLINLSPKIYNIIELLGFHKILEIYEGMPEALAKFNQ